MKRLTRLLLCVVALVIPSAGLGLSRSQALVIGSPEGVSPAIIARAEVADPDKLVYADFENLKERRPYSNRGGHISLFSYQEQPTNPVKFKGIEGTDAPEAVRLKQDDPNRAITFEYEMIGPNAWAGVGVEIYG
ncbi:MAG TPA: hypothetical protein VG778_07895, partial [Blastocatellia bacterium]|nr:hypothetical protein [Blastocatellia bacterium]